MADENLSFNHQNEVLAPRKTTAYPIPVSEWQLIRKRVNAGLEQKSDFFPQMGWALIGGGLGALSTVVSSPEPTDLVGAKAQYRIWAFFFVALASGVLCHFFHHRLRKHSQERFQTVAEDMDQIEQRYKQS